MRTSVHVFKDGGREQWGTVNAAQTAQKVMVERQTAVDDDRAKMHNYLFFFLEFVSKPAALIKRHSCYDANIKGIFNLAVTE